MNFISKYKLAVLSFVSILCYFFVAYFLKRTQFLNLVSVWSMLFILFYFLIKEDKVSFKNLVGLSILFRLIFLFATPNLSQDFYRFIWDGRMIFEGLNPYLYLPQTFIEQGYLPISQAKELYIGMGELNGSHYTNYPPINQLNFLIAVIFSSQNILGSVIVFRLQIILADLGILYFGSKLLERLNINKKNIFWYALNPFIIIEMTGNLHFEPVMLFFFIFGLYKLHQQKWIFAAVLIGCSISVKLIPLLFLPLFFRWFTQPLIAKKNEIVSWSGFKLQPKNLLKLIGFYSIVLFTVALLFLPFYSSTLIDNYTNSVGLWFRNFEFNASFYYVFREIGYLFRGYNEIAILGKIAPITTVLVLIYFSFFNRNYNLKKLFTAMLIVICCYYFLSTTIHPWYVATPLILSIFTKYRFILIWSFSVIFSYQAYSNLPWQENLIWVAIEYLLVFSYLFYELKNRSSKALIN